MTQEIADARFEKESAIASRERWGIAIRIIAAIIFCSFLLFKEPDLGRAYGLSTNAVAALQAFWISSLPLWFVGGVLISNAKAQGARLQDERDQLQKEAQREQERQRSEAQAREDEAAARRLANLYAEEAEKLRARLAISPEELEKARSHFGGFLDQFALLRRGWPPASISNNDYLGLPHVVVNTAGGEKISMWPTDLALEYEDERVASNGTFDPQYADALLAADDARIFREEAALDRRRAEEEVAAQLARQIKVDAKDL